MVQGPGPLRESSEEICRLLAVHVGQERAVCGQQDQAWPGQSQGQAKSVRVRA
jgi:hypothetical protein